MNLFEKISKIMENVKGLAKDTEVGYNGKVQYKALSENKVTKVLRDQLIAQKIIVYPTEQVYSRSGNITAVNTRYRMVNAENPEEYIDIASSGEGSDTQDKGAGKAMTYAFKYMLLRTFAIPTGEDADFIHSDTLTDMERQVPKPDAKTEEPKAKKSSKKDAKPDPIPMISQKQLDEITRMCRESKVCSFYAQEKLKEFGENVKVRDLTMAQATKMIGDMQSAVQRTAEGSDSKLWEYEDEPDVRN